MKFTEKDSILIMNISYGAVKKLIKHEASKTNTEVIEINVTFPTTRNSLIQLVKQHLKPNTKFAIFDHVTSVTGIVLPVKELIQVCKEK
jgi:selenocysteine lyase/cysteine desulfurase